jgi:hypothetical protein
MVKTRSAHVASEAAPGETRPEDDLIINSHRAKSSFRDSPSQSPEDATAEAKYRKDGGAQTRADCI